VGDWVVDGGLVGVLSAGVVVGASVVTFDAAVAFCCPKAKTGIKLRVRRRSLAILFSVSLFLRECFGESLFW
jgi:hypothetical protein